MRYLKWLHYIWLATIAWMGYNIYPTIVRRGHELGFWITIAVMATLIFLDAYMENEHEKMFPSRFARLVGKIWGYFAICFYFLVMLIVIGLTIWILVSFCQFLSQSRWWQAGLMFLLADVLAVFVIAMFIKLRSYLYYLRHMR